MDHDNEPAPDNVVQHGDAIPDIFNTQWGHSGICYRSASNTQSTPLSLEFPRGVTPSIQQMFEMMFPEVFLIDIILASLNESIVLHVSYRWFLLTTHQGAERDGLLVNCSTWSIQAGKV